MVFNGRFFWNPFPKFFLPFFFKGPRISGILILCVPLVFRSLCFFGPPFGPQFSLVFPLLKAGVKGRYFLLREFSVNRVFGPPSFFVFLAPRFFSPIPGSIICSKRATSLLFRRGDLRLTYFKSVFISGKGGAGGYY